MGVAPLTSAKSGAFLPIKVSHDDPVLRPIPNSKTPVDLLDRSFDAAGKTPAFGIKPHLIMASNPIPPGK
jgi:hypothetical protein